MHHKVKGDSVGSGGTSHVRIGHITKPHLNKHTAISETYDHEPIPVHGCTEIHSSMARSRYGTHESHERYGDRMFGHEDRPHPMATVQDDGENPSVSKRQRRLMAAAEHGADFPEARKIRASMSHAQMHDFAVTKESHLPEKKHKRR